MVYNQIPEFSDRFSLSKKEKFVCIRDMKNICIFVKKPMIYCLILIISTLIATSKALLCKVIGSENTTKKDTMLLNFKAFFVAFFSRLLR